MPRTSQLGRECGEDDIGAGSATCSADRTGDAVSLGSGRRLIQLALHALQRLIHLLKHLFRRDPELAQLSA